MHEIDGLPQINTFLEAIHILKKPLQDWVNGHFVALQNVQTPTLTEMEITTER